MKNIIFATILLSLGSAMAHEVEGTLVLKGALKTNTVVGRTKVSCKVRIEKVKNSLTEDSFGNPGYNVDANVSVVGGPVLTPERINFDENIRFHNIFTESGILKTYDEKYFGDKAKAMLIVSGEGRLVSLTLSLKQGPVECRF